MGRVIRDSVKTWTADQIVQVIESGLHQLGRTDRDAALSVIAEFRDRGTIGRTGRRAAAMLVGKLAKRVHKEVGSMSDTKKRESLHRGDPVVVVETYGNGRNTRELRATIRETTRHAAKVRFDDGTERMIHYKHILLKSEPAPPPPVEAPPPVEPSPAPERPPLRLVPPAEELVLDRDAFLRDEREADARRKAEEEAMPKTPTTPPTQRTRSKPVPVSEVPEPNVAFGELADVATSDSGARYSPTRIGPFVRAVRLARGEYQWKTGRTWGLEQTPQSLVSSIERSQRIPTDDELIAIAQWGCPFEWGGVAVTLEVLIAWRDRDLRDRERWYVERRKAGGKHSARTKQATRAAAGGSADVLDVLCIYHDCPDARAQAPSPEDATCPSCIERWEAACAAVEAEAEAERAAAEEQRRREEVAREAPKSTPQTSEPTPVRSSMFRVDFWASGTKVRTIDLTPDRWAMLLDLAAEE